MTRALLNICGCILQVIPNGQVRNSKYPANETRRQCPICVCQMPVVLHASGRDHAHFPLMRHHSPSLVFFSYQSLIADYYDELDRGKAFGALYLTGAIGAMLGTLYATNLGEGVGTHEI